MKKFKDWVELHKKQVEVLIGFIIIAVLALIMVLTNSLGGKVEDTVSENSVESEFDTSSDYYKEIAQGLENLKTLSGNYIIANTMELPSDSMCYIEVTTADGNYTEYPVDESGNYGTIYYDESEETEYIMYDYLTNDNDVYIMNGSFNSDDEDNDYIWLHMPKSYGEDIASRKYMYVDKMINYLSDITYDGEVNLDSDSEELTKVYTARIPDYVVKEICGIDTLGLYQHIREDNIDNESIVNLMDVYLEQFDETLTFSKGTVIFGINSDGVLSYMQLSAGGLGTRMYYTKSLVQSDTFEVQSLPSFESTDEYMTNIVNLAEYIASFDSYDDAMDALYNSTDSVDSIISGDEEIIGESTEEVIEEDNTESVVEESTKKNFRGRRIVN